MKMWKTPFTLLLISFATNGETRKNRVCIVGAGVSGLVAAKSFSEYPNEFETVVFEKNSDVGGLWIYTDSTTVDEHGLPVHSSMYKHLWTNTIKEVMIIPDYQDFGDETSNGRFLKHECVLEYLKNYTNHFNLRQYIQLNTNVVKIKPLSQLRWLIITQNLNTSKKSKRVCDVTVLCHGHNVKGYIPDIWGIESFTGQVLHSQVYRKPDMFANLTVVVLGALYSGTDISIDISTVAKKVFLSHRHDKLLGAFPTNMEQVPGVVGAESDKLILSNGTKIRADALIFCTGYRFDFPFLDESSGIDTAEGGKYIHPIHKHLINIERPTMAIIDVASQVLHFPQVHAQANYFRAVIRGKLNLPNREQMLLEAQMQLTNSSSGKGHITSIDQFWKYYDELVIPVNGKRLPWWVVPYVDKLKKLSSKDPVQYRDKRLVIHENNRSIEFV